MLPLSYAIRNLTRSHSRFAQMLVGSALVVLLIVAATAFSSGMHRALSASGNAQNVIFLGAGSEESVERSEVPAASSGIIAASIRGLHHDLGRPAVSGEVHYMGLVDIGDGVNREAQLRGVTASAMQVHRAVRIIDGHFPRPDEVMIGARAYHQLGVERSALVPGATLRFEDRSYTISGIFVAPETVLEAELWLDRNDLMAVTQRDTLSCVVARLDTATVSDAELFCAQRLDLELVVLGEREYYGKLASFFAPLRWMAWITAALIAAGAVFGGLNTLYAAFAARIRELAALQAIGFRRRSSPAPSARWSAWQRPCSWWMASASVSQPGYSP